jgi:NAD(P)-dependent dehydrogenase (short-subunit alcohol dehydrogenase family)
VKLLIVGARAGSLGEALLEAATTEWSDNFSHVHTAGISSEEFKLDITNTAHIVRVLSEVSPDCIVCTVGVNQPTRMTDTFLPSRMTDAFHTNVIGPMHLLSKFADLEPNNPRQLRRFVAISSNSARIARTGSVAYCASKAALSMALRVAGREFARNRSGILVWGYEPGLLNTTMTREMFPNDPRHFPEEGPLHRMEGVHWKGLPALALADRILGDLLLGTANGLALNGCLIPFDAGEQ